ncbi:MAG TPA: P-loop NTPase [Steroidobacteraceae bacterium]
MSIIERALQKLQSGGRPAAPPASPSPAPTPLPSVRAPDPAHREPRAVIGDPSRAVTIDFDALRRSGLLPPEHQQRELAHQFRTIKRPLIRNAFDVTATAPARSAPRTVMVTSALPGEGKTFNSINLALSMSLEKDYSVILVDGDVARPQLSNVFGVLDQPGLLDVLADSNVTVASVVRPTNVRGLSILPVGRRTETATELLASARMRHTLAQLEQLDPQAMILVDSPPVLVTSEARVLASLFAQVVVVVRAGATPQEAVLEAISIIGEGPRIGMVLNQVTHGTVAGSYYGYDSYSGYGTDAAAPGADSAGGGVPGRIAAVAGEPT